MPTMNDIEAATTLKGFRFERELMNWETWTIDCLVLIPEADSESPDVRYRLTHKKTGNSKTFSILGRVIMEMETWDGSAVNR